jgi:hypothetical protein
MPKMTPVMARLRLAQIRQAYSPRHRSTSPADQHPSSVAYRRCPLPQFHSLLLWTILPTTRIFPAAEIHGPRRQNTTASPLDNLPLATSPRPRCLRKRHPTAKVPSNMATWANTMRKPAQIPHLRMATIHSSRL